MSGFPERLGPYQIRGRLHAGGMGVVYLGWDERLGRQVAVKTLGPSLAQDEEARVRFLREARAAAALSHPNLTPIYDIGEEDGQAYYAMEYLEGRSLQELIKDEGRIPLDRALVIMRQAASGLKAAAERDIVHRDIKPSNLMFAADGSLKVCDFGLAKQKMAETNLTVSGQLLGTPHYIAPEQAAKGLADARSDMYSLGATFYEMLTGATPFAGPTPMSVVLKHLNEPPPSPRKLVPGLPYPVETLIRKMMSKDPAARHQDYTALLADLARLEAMVAAPPPTATSPRPRAQAPDPGGRSIPWGMLAAAALVLAGAAGILNQRGELPVEPLMVRSPEHLQGVAAAQPNAGREQADLTPFRPPPPAVVNMPLSEEEAPVPAAPVPQQLPLPLARRDAARRLLAGSGGRNKPATEQGVERPRARLEIVDHGHEITAEGRLQIKGQVINRGEARSTGGRVRITLRDSNGQELGSSEARVYPPRLGPGELGIFSADFPDPESQVRFEMELSWIS